MSKTFKRFLKEDAEKSTPSKSIEYMEDLPVNDFIAAIENLKDYIVTEKLDGTAMAVGVDNTGALYTSRQGKGSNKLVKDADEYGRGAAANVFKAAHKALQANEKTLKRLIKPGEAFDIEVLYGTQPNAIVYNAPGVNHIAFLKATIGTDPTKRLDHSRVMALGEALKSAKTTVNIEGVDTPDGLELIDVPIITTWKFMTPKFISAEALGEVDVHNELNALKKYLTQVNDAASSYAGRPVANSEIAVMNMATVPTAAKDTVKAQKDQILDVIKNDFVMNIKDVMLEKFIRNFSGSMHNAEIDQQDDVDIEGLVFLNPKTGLQFKLIDVDVFRDINQFNYKVRLMVKGKILTDNPDASLASRGGIYGASMIRIVNLLNIPDLARPGSAKKTLLNFKGATEDETVNNIVQSLGSAPNYNSIKTKILAVLDDTDANIVNALRVFNDEHDTYELQLKNGKTVKYTQEIVKRTLLTFAETRRTVAELRSKIAKTRSLQDLIFVLFGRQISSIHGNEE